MGTGGPAQSLLLTGGQPAAGNGPSPAPVTLAGESTTAAGSTALDQVFAGSSGGSSVAALSGPGSGLRSARPMSTWVDPLSGQLADELVSSLVPVV
jgi:hypothetical protein